MMVYACRFARTITSRGRAYATPPLHLIVILIRLPVMAICKSTRHWASSNVTHMLFGYTDNKCTAGRRQDEDRTGQDRSTVGNTTRLHPPTPTTVVLQIDLNWYLTIDCWSLKRIDWWQQNRTEQNRTQHDVRMMDEFLEWWCVS